jgi:hypothetical protein
MLNDSGIEILSRFEQTGSMDDLDYAIEVKEKVIERSF